MKKNISQPSVIDYAGPTITIMALSSKLSLCMLMLGTSLLFFSSNSKTFPLPKIYKKWFAISLVLLPCLVAIASTYEFTRIMDKYSTDCVKQNACLYDIQMIRLTKVVYITCASVFSTICLTFAFVMIKY